MSEPRPGDKPRLYLGVQWKLVAAAWLLLLLGAAIGAGFLWYLPKLGIVAVVASALALIYLGGFWAGRSLARPLKERLKAAEYFASALARGNLQQRLETGPYDEIGQLEEMLNFMAAEMENTVAQIQELAETNRQLAAQGGRLAALEERTRLARELHDTVNQRLFSLALLGAGASRRLAPIAGVPPEVLADLREIEEVARETHQEMRQLILQLRSPSLEQHGLGPVLEEYCRGLAAKQGWAISVDTNGTPRLPIQVEEAILRIVQEALNNVVKHAQASQVEVRLRQEGEQIVLNVVDDGVGLDPLKPIRPTSFGLKGMRERAAALGGQVSVEPGKAGGTVVTLTLPFKEESQ